MNTSTDSKSSNRIRLLAAIAVLAGAVILLLVTELASLPSEEDQTVVKSAGPTASSALPEPTR